MAEVYKTSQIVNHLSHQPIYNFKSVVFATVINLKESSSKRKRKGIKDYFYYYYYYLPNTPSIPKYKITLANLERLRKTF